MSTIYGLIDSDTLELRYVGQTTKVLAHRLSQHRYGGPNLHLNHWLAARSVSIITLERDPDDLNEAEIRWIRDMREQGARLLNITDGGAGSGPHSAESRAKISAAQVGHTQSAETRARISTSLTGRTLSAMHRENLQGNRNALGYRHTPEARQAISNASQAYWAERSAT